MIVADFRLINIAKAYKNNGNVNGNGNVNVNFTM